MPFHTVATLCLLALSLFACGADPEPCVDLDGDGYGADCELGADCDDDNAARNVDCDRVPPPDCVAAPFATGCPCLPGATSDCYAGPADTAGVGLCRAGNVICINGHWGICDGEVMPRGEICDGVDQDCDGYPDDGVRSPCGGCTLGCEGGVWGEADAPFEASSALFVGPEGDLTLAYGERLDAVTVWVPNSGDGTVSKIDATRAVEVARYDSGGLEPSRVAVDYFGDAWIANRELDGGVSSVTKIAGSMDRCVDRDGDLAIATSTGPSNVLPRGEDECILFRVPVGTAGGVARALAIDGDLGLDGSSGGNVWVGLHDAGEVVELDGLTGAVLDRVTTPGFAPYAASFDAWGTLWLTARDGYVARIDRRARPRAVEVIEVPLACYLLYSLVIDARGELFMTGFSCDDLVAYDPRRNRFRNAGVPPSPRGIGIAAGDLFMAHTGGLVSRVDPTTLRTSSTFDLTTADAAPLESIGVAADALGHLWIASTQGGPGGVGVATALSAEDGTVLAQVPVGLAPHAQGDLTGAELLGGFEPEGVTSHVFRGCPDGSATDWLRLHVDALVGAAGTVALAVRHAADVASLASVAFTTLGTLPDDIAPFDLGAPDGGVLEVQLTLRTAQRDGAPRVLRVGVEWSCPGPM